MGRVEGTLALLTAASQYKRRDPTDLEEAELIENTFGCLVLTLQQPENQHLFLKVRLRFRCAVRPSVEPVSLSTSSSNGAIVPPSLSKQ